MKRIMVTGSGGVAGVNFVRSIRVAREKIFIVGTDYYPYHLEWSDLDVKYCYSTS
jgi:carbamoyl-phosphate synthase large subunit